MPLRDRANQKPLAAAGPAPGAASVAGPKPRIAVTMGDPFGIGPEIVVKALADKRLRSRASFLVYGVDSALHAAADAAGIAPYWWRVRHDSPLADTAGAHDVVVLDFDEFAPALAAAAPLPTTAEPVSASKLGGMASFLFCEQAIADAKRTVHDPLRVDGIVTAPISKAAWAKAGRGKYPGHTDLLADRFGAKRCVMAFVSPKLRVALATGHLPLMELRNAMTIGRVFDPIDLGASLCADLGLDEPRIAVCGLNPHAGEGGLLGEEEARLIEPAIEHAQRVGIDAHGPYPADTIFGRAVKGEFDLVVAMYHDQGLIPVKLLDWEHAVNVTVGLPTVRTSPDHGTAFGIAGKNRADPSSMCAAVSLAVDLAKGRAAKAARVPTSDPSQGSSSPR